jgi:hypothetical protein
MNERWKRLAKTAEIVFALCLFAYFTGIFGWIGNFLSQGETPALSSQTNRTTKAQWRAKVMQAYGRYPAAMNTIPGWNAKQFQSLLGAPDQTQTVGDHAYWYYRCSDGTIQLALNAQVLALAGIMQGNINDY